MTTYIHDSGIITTDGEFWGCQPSGHRQLVSHIVSMKGESYVEHALMLAWLDELPIALQDGESDLDPCKFTIPMVERLQDIILAEKVTQPLSTTALSVYMVINVDHCWHGAGLDVETFNGLDRCCWCRAERVVITETKLIDSSQHGPHVSPYTREEVGVEFKPKTGQPLCKPHKHKEK